MAETLLLATPITPTKPTITGYLIWSLYLGRGEGVIRIVLEDNTFERMSFQYMDGSDKNGNPAPGTTIATDMLVALNKTNLSTKSMHRRILERLMVDLPAKFTGSITGTPD